jgi:diphosphomevalonate decarboxylase
LRLPANASFSVNLANLVTTTTVAFDRRLDSDQISLDGVVLAGDQAQRVVAQLDRVRVLGGRGERARVVSRNNFPSGAGLASSASGFAALTVAAASAAGLDLGLAELSALARQGSGSACRSVPGGWVEWLPAVKHEASYGVPVAPPAYWALADVIAIVETEHKAVGSTAGHALADTSPLQAARVATTPARFQACKAALLARDFERLAPVVEMETLMMHAVMLTSTPPLMYWAPVTLYLMQQVRAWRSEGVPVAFTLDAGPNVHCLCLLEAAAEVERRLQRIPGVQRVMRSTPGGPARLLDSHLF